MPETKTILTRRLVAPALIAIALAFPVGIAAHTTEQIAETGGMTLPILGAALTVEIKLDAVGHISEVNFTAAGTLTESDHKVTFANDDGTTRVDVKASGHKLAVKAKTGSLDDLVGTHVWSSAVFGGETESTVEYTIGNDGGRPTLVLGAIGVPADADVTATASDVKTSGNNVSGKVTFESDGYVKTLKFWVHADQGGGKAMLRIVLSGKDKQRLAGPITELVGDRSWTAHLCDGTEVSVNYRVNDNGTVTFVNALPATAAVSVKTKGKGFTATFDGTKVRVSVSLKVEGTSAELKVDGKTGKCKDDKAKKVKAERKEKPAKATREDES